MRYMLTLAAVHDDDLDAADLEAATDTIWGNLEMADESVVVYTTLGAAVLDRIALADVLSALMVGSDGAINPETVASVAQTLSDAASGKATR